MMKLDVDDIEGWHVHAKAVIDDGDFGHAQYDKQIKFQDARGFCERCGNGF